jgi:phosphate transport system substrate-binding protein
MPRLLIAALFTACVDAYAQQAVPAHPLADSTIPPYTSHSQLSGHFTSVGTDTMKDLMTSWIEGFTKLHPQVSIELQAKGSLTAAPALIEGTAQLAPLSRAKWFPARS